MDRPRRRVGALPARRGNRCSPGRSAIGFASTAARTTSARSCSSATSSATTSTNQVLLIKTAWGGKSLYKRLPPAEFRRRGRAVLHEDDRRGPQGAREPEDRLSRATTARATNWPASSGIRAGTTASIRRTAVPEYEQNLVNLINDVRKEFEAPEAAGRHRRTDRPVGGRRRTRGTRCARPRPPPRAGRSSRATCCSSRRTTSSASPKDSPNPGHGHHEFGNAETYFLVGDALGKAAVKLLAKNENHADNANAKQHRSPADVAHRSQLEGWTIRVDDRLLKAPE